MSLPNFVQGARKPSIEITWYLSDTSVPENLSDATLTGLIQALSGTRAITGTLTVTDGPGGVFRWDLSAEDVAGSGNLLVQFVATFGSGQTPAKTFAADWFVEAALVVV